MIKCQTTANGISCFIPHAGENISFEVDNISQTYLIIDEYMTSLFEDSMDMEFEHSKNLVQICESQLIRALQDYDKFILASKLYENDELKEQVLDWAPEFKDEIQANLAIAQEKEMFNIEGFYVFADMDVPNDRKDYKYLFCGLERSENLDQLIIGLWVKNHVSYEQMLEKFFNEQVQK